MPRARPEPEWQDDGESQPPLAVAFACCDCLRSTTRFTRGDPASIRRCIACERTLIRTTSDRLLTLVFGPPAR